MCAFHTSNEDGIVLGHDNRNNPSSSVNLQLSITVLFVILSKPSMLDCAQLLTNKVQLCVFTSHYIDVFVVNICMIKIPSHSSCSWLITCPHICINHDLAQNIATLDCKSARAMISSNKSNARQQPHSH